MSLQRNMLKGHVSNTIISQNVIAVMTLQELK